MDDFIIMHQDKKYLEKCIKIIIHKLKEEFLLEVNDKKTHIINIKNGFIFLGYRFMVKNHKTISLLRNETYNKIKKNVKKNTYLFKNKKINFGKYFSLLNNYLYSYRYGSKTKVQNYIKTTLMFNYEQI